MSRRLLLVALLVLPSLAAGQRGGGTRSQADKRTELFGKDSMPKGPSLRARDLEDQSPLKLLIDKRKDLKLTDAQLSTLKDAEPKLKETDAPLLKAVDSLVHELRPSGNSSAEERTRLRDARVSLMTVLVAIRTSYDEAGKAAITSLDADQQSKAKDLLAKQQQETEKLLSERMGGGRP
ncbi:MAG: hypothetical protein JWM41_2159 [Gemmatimonadetes bacterium]|nr:hypothetical protein [Gemmatimonadota bacterium]